MKSAAFQNIDSYIASFPKDIQETLEILRATIHKAAPDAIEKISYGMPTFALGGNLVYFAAYKKHIGFYPSSSGIAAFSKEFNMYKWAKGSVQFPLDKPMPLELITRIVKYRVKENLAKSKGKKHGRQT
jgi:uncharacterized protein YdhG (YjbR/CyaY superfamily)